jgi:beta-galactosidase
MDDGWISAHELYVSADGQNWGAPAAEGVFEKNGKLKKVPLPEPVRARFLRFIAKDGFDGKPFAAIAEIDIE